MHELSTDSEVTFHRKIGSAEILPTRPGIDPFEDTRPMPDLSCIQQSPITATSPSVIEHPRTQSGSVPPSSSHIFGLQPSPWSTLDQPNADHTSLQTFSANNFRKTVCFQADQSTTGSMCSIVSQCRQFQEDAKDASVSECTWTGVA